MKAPLNLQSILAKTAIVSAFVFIIVIFFGPSVFSQGDLIPPGPPAPLMKTLDQVEPRTPISNLPFTITVPGSYYLTTNLTGSPSSDGITIEASGVTIDMNGFLLEGSGIDSGHGIFQSDASYHSTTIKNGSLANWRGPDKSGLQLEGEANRVESILAYGNNQAILSGAGAVITDCTARDNGGSSEVSGGILAGAGSVLSRCAAYGNQMTGASGLALYCQEGSVIEGCSAVGNQFGGTSAVCIAGGSGTIIRNCVVRDNTSTGGFTGILVVEGGEISDCSSHGNTVSGGVSVGISGGNGTLIRSSSVYGHTTDSSIGIGISTGSGGSVVECNVSGQIGMAANQYGIFALFDTTIRGCNVSNNAKDGIRFAARCVVRGNVCNGNGRYGIEALQSESVIDDNVVKNNASGLVVVSTGNLITSNRAAGNTTGNYSIAIGNNHGPIVTLSGAGDLSAVTNAGHPLANFSD